MTERKKTERKPRARKPSVKMEAPWWDGLPPEIARDLEARGYRSREDALLFAGRLRFLGTSDYGRRTLFDPLHHERPWLRDGIPLRISLQTVNAVRAWLGVRMLEPGAP